MSFKSPLSYGYTVYVEYQLHLVIFRRHQKNQCDH